MLKLWEVLGSCTSQNGLMVEADVLVLQLVFLQCGERV